MKNLIKIIALSIVLVVGVYLYDKEIIYNVFGKEVTIDFLKNFIESDERFEVNKIVDTTLLVHEEININIEKGDVVAKSIHNLNTAIVIPLTKVNSSDIGRGYMGYTYQELIDTILNINPNIDHSLTTTMQYTYEFDNYNMWVLMFRDKNGYFLDVISISKHPKSKYMINNASNLNYFHDLKRKLVDFESDLDKNYKLIFDDNSYITIIFDYKDEDAHLSRYFEADHKTKKSYKFGKKHWKYNELY